MDIGVGCFVFSMGVVQGRPGSSTTTLGKTLLQAVPLFLLGFSRLVLVKSSDYHEHVSEYGVHWNFFFTLAFLPPFVYLCRSLGLFLDSAVLGVSLAALYQWLLTSWQLETWVLEAPRLDWISSNKEGICSLMGYLSIFFFGSRAGEALFQPRTYAGWRRTLFQLWAVTVALWAVFLVATGILEFPTSRRLVRPICGRELVSQLTC